MSEKKEKKNLKGLWIALAFLALIIITFLPNNGDVPIAGQRSLAILAFAVILWVTEAVSYPVSAAMIIAITAISLGFAPTIEDPSATYTTAGALKMILEPKTEGRYHHQSV